MAITMQDVRKWLDPEEVDYANAKKLGPAALPFLLELVNGGDLSLASKATYLASLIKGKKSAAVLEAALAKDEPVLKSAAAAGMRNLTDSQAERVMTILQDDKDPSIRKVALKSAAAFKSPAIVAKVQQLSASDPEPYVRELAGQTLQKMKRKPTAAKKKKAAVAAKKKTKKK